MGKQFNIAKFGKRLLLLAVALILVCAGLVFAHQHSLIYPTDGNQSAFYQTYDLEPALKPFVSIHHLAHGGGISDARAGKQAKLHREINKVFALQGANRLDLMTVLSEDISSQLDRSGVQVTGMTGSDANGFQFRYVDRNGEGTVALKPVALVDPYEVRAPSKSHPEKKYLPPLCDGELPVSVTVVIDESWSRPGG